MNGAGSGRDRDRARRADGGARWRHRDCRGRSGITTSAIRARTTRSSCGRGVGAATWRASTASQSRRSSKPTADPARIQDRDRQDARHSRGQRDRWKRGSAPLQPKNRLRRPRSARLLPPGPARRGKSSRSTIRRRGRRESAQAPANSFPPPAARMRRQASLQPPPTRTRTDREDRRMDGGGGPTSRGGHLPVAGARPRLSPDMAQRRRAGQNAGINIAASRGAPVAGGRIPAPSPMPATRSAATVISCWSSIRTAASRPTRISNALTRQARRYGQARPGDREGRDTGGVSEPQLHFELRRGKNAVDPRRISRARGRMPAAEEGVEG